MKKFISYFMCAVLMLCIGIQAFAADTNPKIVFETKTAKQGDTVSVALTLENNPGIAYLRVTFEYAENLTLTGVQNGTVLKDMDSGKNIVWSEDTDSFKNGTLAVLTFKVADNASEGDYSVNVKVRECYNSRSKNVNVTVTGGKINVNNENVFEKILQYILKIFNYLSSLFKKIVPGVTQ